MCALNCERVDLARRELRVIDAKTPAVVRRVDIHDDLHDELAAHRAARGIRVGERVERLLQAVTLSDERPQLSRANREFGANSIKWVGYALLPLSTQPGWALWRLRGASR